MGRLLPITLLPKLTVPAHPILRRGSRVCFASGFRSSRSTRRRYHARWKVVFLEEGFRQLWALNPHGDTAARLSRNLPPCQNPIFCEAVWKGGRPRRTTAASSWCRSLTRWRDPVARDRYRLSRRLTGEQAGGITPPGSPSSGRHGSKARTAGLLPSPNGRCGLGRPGGRLQGAI